VPSVVEAGLGIAALVLDVAILVAIAVVVDPGHGGARLALDVAHELVVPRPALVFLEQDEEQHRAVGGAVVGRVRPILERGQLAQADLVQDLPRLGVPERIVLARLQEGQRPERGRRQLGDEGERLEAGEQAIAPEHRHEPGEARRRQGTRRDADLEAQGGQVDQAAAVDIAQRLPARDHPGRG
jgi:hypothetical protein